MSPRPIKNAVFAGLSAAVLWSIQILPYTESRYCSILNVNGGNGVAGHGFGIDTSGRIPRSGTSGDAGADATAFTPVDNPNPVCGSVAKLHGSVKIADQTAKSIAAGVPTVLLNGSISLDVFQVDRNGGGPMDCEYSADGTGNLFEPMDVTLNLPGNFGAFPADRKTWRVVATFKEGSRCSGGPDKNICLVRCRAGQTSETAQKNLWGLFHCKTGRYSCQERLQRELQRIRFIRIHFDFSADGLLDFGVCQPCQEESSRCP